MGFFEDVDINAQESSQDESIFEMPESDNIEIIEEIDIDEILEEVEEQTEKETKEKQEIKEKKTSLDNTKTKQKVSDKKELDVKEKDNVTIITIGTIIEGDIITEDNVLVNGIVNGNIVSKAGVTVFRKGTVNGNIEAVKRVSIFGNVSGNIIGNEIGIGKTKITGDIKSTGPVLIDTETIVLGNISGTSAKIVGAVNGDIDIQGPVLLEKTAIVQGSIKSKSVQIENGAIINGLCSQCYAERTPIDYFNNV